MKLKYIAIIFTTLLIGKSKPSFAQFGIEGDSDFSKFDVSQLILNSDLIASGKATFYKVDKFPEGRTLFELRGAKTLSGEIKGLVETRDIDGKIIPNASKSIYFLDTNINSMYSPVPIDDKENLLFLKLDEDDGLSKQYGIPGKSVVYEMCESWKGAVVMENGFKCMAQKVILDSYGIKDMGKIDEMIRVVSGFKNEKTDDEKFSYLAEKLNSYKDQKIYVDNLSGVVKGLGRVVKLVDGKYSIEKVTVGRPMLSIQVPPADPGDAVKH